MYRSKIQVDVQTLKVVSVYFQPTFRVYNDILAVYARKRHFREAHTKPNNQKKSRSDLGLRSSQTRGIIHFYADFWNKLNPIIGC